MPFLKVRSWSFSILTSKASIMIAAGFKVNRSLYRDWLGRYVVEFYDDIP